jgi:hypothetical protein
MGPSPSANAADDVRESLRRLAAHGVESYWLHEVGQPLFALRQVRRRFRDGRASSLEEAVVQVLREAAADLTTPSRRIVEIVLGLDPQYLGKSAQERRTLAGEQFRGGARPVAWGTIRQYHEPKAIDELAVKLADRERDFDADPLPSEAEESNPPESQLTCFVIGPIGNRHAAIGSTDRETFEESLRVMEEVIRPACSRFGLTPVRADSLGRAGEINEQIFRRLRDDDVVIADLTGANANVMYELGLRHTRQKLTVQIGEFGRLPFDINTIRTIQFSRSPIGLINARDELIQMLEAGLAGGFDPVTATRVWENATTPANEEEVGAQVTSDGEPDQSGAEGFVDVMATAEEQQDALVPAVEAVASCLQSLGDLAQMSAEEMARSDAAGKGMRGRLQIATRHAQGLTTIATELDQAVDNYVAVLTGFGAGTLALIQRMEEDPAALAELEEFGMLTRQLAMTTRGSMTQLAGMVEAMNTGAKLSRVLREPTKRVTSALDRFTRATSIVDEWDRRLQALGVPVPPEGWTPTWPGSDSGSESAQS